MLERITKQKILERGELHVKTIAVIGAGYVGLVTGACLAQRGNTVIMVEKDQEKIAALLQGNVPFYEPGLNEIVAYGITHKKISFVHNIAQALSYKPEIIFSCVGTPSAHDGSADLSYVWHVATEIGQHLTQYSLIVNKSTVPVGTVQAVTALIQKQLDVRQSSITFDVASNPEFLKEGDAVNDFLQPDRVVVGVTSEQAKKLLYDLYKPLLEQDDQFIAMNPVSAELTKYAANGMLATRISFMNQIALFADTVGADVEAVKRGIASDKRIGKHFLNAGIGYGGSCFPKDVKALIHMGTEHHQPMTLMQEVDNVNHQQRSIFINKIIKHYNYDLTHKKIGILGLAFKPETDDIRCAPAIDVINKLLEHKATIYAYDPVAMDNMKKLYKNNVQFCESAEDVIHNVDALIILTEWKQFILINPIKFAVLTDKIVFDGRNCFDPTLMNNLGITYVNVGRNSLSKRHESCQTTTNQSHKTTINSMLS